MPPTPPRQLRDARRDAARVLDQRSRLLAEGSRRGALDLSALREMDDQWRDVVDGMRAVVDPCDADPDVPLALLPVRLETRYTTDGRALRVRIFPDTVHVDHLDRGLDDAEREAGETYWRGAWTADEEGREQLWRELLTRVHPARAAWVVRVLTPINLARLGTRDDQPLRGGDDQPLRGTDDGPRFPRTGQRLRRGPVARALPDRFVVTVVQGKHRASATGEAVPLELSLGIIPDAPSPGNQRAAGLPVPPGAEWLVDFDAAVAVGMAVAVDLPVPGGDVDRVFAVGVRAVLDPKRAARELADLLVAHRFTGGLSVLPQGTATNNADGERSPWRSQEQPAAPALPRERAEAGSNAEDLASAFGVAPAVLAGIDHGDGREQPLAAAANTALWGPGWGTFLEKLAKTSAGKPLDDALREAVRDLFRDRVRGRGPIPAIRVGRQPYGILPVTTLQRWEASEREAAGVAEIVPLLRRARDRWWRCVSRVPRIRFDGAGNVAEDFVDVLGSAPVMQGLRVRPVVDSLLTDFYAKAVGVDPEDIALEHALTTAVLHDVCGTPLEFAYGSLAKDSRPLPLPLVDSTDPAYIADLLAGRTQAVKSVLQALLALAWDRAERDVARTAPVKKVPDLVDLAVTAETVPRGLLDPVEEILPSVATADARSLHRLADTIVEAVGAGGPALLAAHQPFTALQTSLADAVLTAPVTADSSRMAAVAIGAWARATARRAEVRSSMEVLAAAPDAERHLVVAEALDLHSHRLDAWITAVAESRRAELREAEPVGLTLGAYGVVENLRKGAGTQPDGGWVHAPSVAHAATAGLLRSAHLTHREEGAFVIDLSSRRMRAARHLLDGMRHGQPLPALVGYRIERALNEARLGRFVLSLRALAPLVAGRLTGRGRAMTRIARAVASSGHVVDGVKLVETYKDNMRDLQEALGRVPADNPYLDGETWEGPNDEEWKRIMAIVFEAWDAIDAVGDLLLAESVHQLAQGNPGRAGAALDAASSGAPQGVEPLVLAAPVPAERLTHRVVLLAGDDPTTWTASRPRARAEPRLESWAAARLGPPERIVVGHTAAGEPVTMKDARLAALDFVYTAGDRAELDAQVRAALPGLPPDAELAARRDPAWAPGLRAYGEVATLATSLRALLVSARPIAPHDLARPGDDPSRGIGDAALEDLRERATSAVELLEARLAELESALNPLFTGSRWEAAEQEEALKYLLAELEAFGAVTGRAGGGRAVAQLARAEVARRVATAKAALARPFDTEVAVDVGRAVFGDGFWLLPAMEPPAADDALASAVSAPAFPPPPRSAVQRFLRDHATVRPAVARHAETLLLGDALQRPAELRVLQLSEVGAEGTDRWLAGPLDPAGPWPAGPVAALVADGPPDLDARAPLSGLVVDSWVEALPDLPHPGGGREDATVTAVAVNAASASARPPQAILLAVAPTRERWSRTGVVELVEEALDLARIRAVTLEHTAGEALVLPALYTQSYSLQGEKALAFGAVGALGGVGAVLGGLAYIKEDG